MSRVTAILPLLALAACGAQNDPAAADNALTEVDASAGADNAAPDASINTAIPPFAEAEGAHPTAPEPAPIPAKFRGIWAESKAACGDLSSHTRLTISGRTVRHPDFVIFGQSVTIPAADQFALKGKIEATGAPAEAHYSINATNDVLTDGAGGGYIRVRCG